MSSNCPLCGKVKTDESLFCPDCTVKLNSEYELDVPALDNSEINSVENEIESLQDDIVENEVETTDDIIEEEPEVIIPPTQLDKKAWKKQKIDKRTESERTYYEINRDKNTNKITYTIIFATVLILTLVAAIFIYNDYVKNNNLERSKWEIAVRENTVDSYLTYMDDYPQGDYSDEAYASMISLKDGESKAWQNLMTSENTTEFTDFLERYPKSPYDRIVKNRFDSLMWESTLKENSTEGYSNYIGMSTSREISGDYVGEAEKRFKLLDQTTPIDAGDMERIKETLNGFFVGLSNLSHEELSEVLAPTIVRFNNSTNISNTVMIGQLMLMASKADAKSLRFDPEITKLKYEKMGNGSYDLNIPLQKIIEGNNGGTNQIKGYIVHLKLNPEFRIYSFHETKPYAKAP